MVYTHSETAVIVIIILSYSACHAHRVRILGMLLLYIYLRPSHLNDDGTWGEEIEYNDIIRIISNKVIKAKRGTLYQVPGGAEKADSRTCGV